MGPSGITFQKALDLPRNWRKLPSFSSPNQDPGEEFNMALEAKA